MFKFALIAAILVALVAASSPPRWHELSDKYTFDKYIADFGKDYTQGTAEYSLREAVFRRRLAMTLAHNANRTQLYKRGVNRFSDWTDAERRSHNQATRDKAPKNGVASLPFQQFNGTGMKLPRSLDYRLFTNPQVLTGVKDQGMCGSCWAHSATEAVESGYALLTGRTAVLSQGQVTDCTPNNLGCGGGSVYPAWDYISTAGIYDAWSYPYTDFWAKNLSKAATNKCENITAKFFDNYKVFPTATVTAMWGVKPNDAAALMEALFTKGPISVGVADADWYDYEHGVFQNSASGSEWKVNHWVQAVGFGFDEDLQVPYWIVRNSWGTQWGEAGFIRLYRPAEEPCGTDMGERVCGTSGVLSVPGFPEVAPFVKK